MKIFIRSFLIAMILIMLTTVKAVAMISEQTRQAATSLGAAGLSEIEFVAGSDALTDAGRADIRNVIDEVSQKGELDHVKVMAWSDQEYPAAKTSQSKANVALAKKRIEAVRKFLKDELKVRNVNGFNMAERPGKLKEFLNTADARVKKTAETAGAAPVQDTDTGLFGEKGQASKAVLMIFTKK